jgi:outer membrane protein assembly factor BamB
MARTLARMLTLRGVLRMACAVVPPVALALSCGGEVSSVPDGDGDAGIGRVGSDAGLASCGPGLQSGAPWPMFGRCPSLAARSAAVGPASPSTKWFFPAEITAQPAVAADGTIYFGTTDGKLYALGGDGSAEWTYAAGAGVAFGGTPAILADGTVLVGARSGPKGIGQLYALSATGTLEWIYDTTRSTNVSTPSPSVGDDGTIYFSVAYHLYAIHPDGSAAWQTDGGGEYAITPAIGPEGTVYVGGQYGLQAFAPGGKPLWAFGPCADKVAECTGQPVVAADGTLVTTVVTLKQSPAFLLEAVHPDGTPAWSLPLASMGVGYAVGADGTIFFPLGIDVFSVSASGRQNWTSRLPAGGDGDPPVIDAAGTMYLGTRATGPSPCGLPCEQPTGAGIQALHADGTTAWVFKTDTAFVSPAIGADGTLYAPALGERGVRPPQGVGLYAIGP